MPWSFLLLVKVTARCLRELLGQLHIETGRSTVEQKQSKMKSVQMNKSVLGKLKKSEALNCSAIWSSDFYFFSSFLTQSELIEAVSPKAALLGIHFIIFFSQHTARDAPSFEGPD